MEEHVSSEYDGFFAEFYDIAHNGNRDAEFYIQLAREIGDPVLEIGSGTGRLLIPILKNNIDITGVEPHPEMITICTRKLGREKLSAELINDTAQDFSTGARFRMAFIACNTFQHFLTIEDQKAALFNIQRHLLPKGSLIIDLCLPDMGSMIENHGKEEVFEYKNPKSNNPIKDHFTATYDFINQIETDNIVLEEFKDDLCIQRTSTTVQMTYFYPRELFLLLESCGYEVSHVWGNYKRVSFRSDSNLIIIEARVK